jgi:hypothetical protein
VLKLHGKSCLCPLYNSFPCFFGGEISSFFNKEIGIFLICKFVNLTNFSLFLGEISSNFQYPKNEKKKIASLKALDQWKVEDVHQRTVLIQQITPPKKFNEFHF